MEPQRCLTANRVIAANESYRGHCRQLNLAIVAATKVLRARLPEMSIQLQCPVMLDASSREEWHAMKLKGKAGLQS